MQNIEGGRALGSLNGSDESCKSFIEEKLTNQPRKPNDLTKFGKAYPKKTFKNPSQLD